MDAWLKGLKLTTKKNQSDAKKNNVNKDNNEPSPSCSSKANLNTTSTSPSVVLPKFIQTEINRIVLPAYPKNDTGRSFHAEWFKIFDWLEYNPEKDVSFCYACRMYGTAENKNRDSAYVKNGYNNWKNALDKKNGLYAHANSQTHEMCMKKWIEHDARMTNNTEVSTLVGDSILSKYRFYVSSIIDIIRFLVVNELPLRGNWLKEEHYETGLFQALFEYTLKQNKELQDCVKIVPENAKYTSGQIQNDIIQAMATCVKNEVSKDVNNADVPFFCIMADGTRDRSNAEAISIVLRFVKNGVPTESLLCIEEAHELTADYLCDLILKTLADNNIDAGKMLSQCYDGAAVMKGWKGGVQALMAEKLNRSIPYVHCFNHQLHLVIINLVKTISDVKQYFDYCGVIHKIFSTFKFKSYYEGKRTSRLLEQRWSGHLKVTKVIYENYKLMIEALSSAVNQEFEELDGITVIECTGLLTIMKSLSFRFVLRLLIKILNTIDSADNILQSRENGLATALPVLQSCYTTLVGYRTDQDFDGILSDCNDLLPDTESSFDRIPSGRSSKRKIKSNERYSDFVLSESSGIHKRGDEDDYKRLYFLLLDTVTNEIRERFLNNSTLFNLIENVNNFNFETGKDIEELRKINKNIKIPTSPVNLDIFGSIS